MSAGLGPLIESIGMRHVFVRHRVIETAGIACLVVASAIATAAQSPIRYFPEKKLWVLDAGEATYAMGVNERGELQSSYWGGRVRAEDLPVAHSLSGWSSFDPSTSTTPQEYPAWGGAIYTQTALKASFPNGNRAVVLHYVDQSLKGGTLEITLKDEIAPLIVHLFYRVYADTGVIERYARIENRTSGPVTLENAQSATWTFAAEQATLRYLTGRWAGEWQMETEQLPIGTRVLESRRGSTSSEVNPWVAISDSTAGEQQGRVWFGALGWSGSWRITVEKFLGEEVRVTGGFSPFDFAYVLAAGESLETPPFYAGYTAKGLGEASRLMHRFELQDILPGGGHPPLRKILYNSWEARVPVTEAAQIAVAEKAASVGIERFVVDAGWFGSGQHGQLGDWEVNPQKFPHGLKPLIDRVHELGMDFGLWVEPESVTPSSRMYRLHPDWIMRFQGRPVTDPTGGFVLNLAREDVKEYVFNWLDKLVTANDIAMLKWDYNRNWSEPGWPEAPLAEQKTIWVKYVQNLYDILDRLRAKHPNLEIEGCSGGGARVDLGMMRRVDQFWPSDNTDALDRLTIQDGFTYPYTPHSMEDWVTDAPDWLHDRATPLKFRFLVAMTGALAIGADLDKWTADDNVLATKMIALYKDIRPTVQNGTLYRLKSPVNAEFSASEYVSQDESKVALFAFLHSQQFGRSVPLLRLQGLDAHALYRLRMTDDALKQGGVVSGAELMNKGLQLHLRGDYDATLIILERAQ
jgi:alpha-galactosidase